MNKKKIAKALRVLRMKRGRLSTVTHGRKFARLVAATLEVAR